MDILAAIDTVIGCQQCGDPLGDSVSDDFCGPSCQQDWHAEHVDPLTSYREPYDLSEYDPDPMRWAPPPEFRLPRSTGNLRADYRAARLAEIAASTEAQRAAVKLRIESIAERQAVVNRARAEAFAVAMQEWAPAIQRTMDSIGEAFRGFAESLSTIANQFTLTYVGQTPESRRPKRDDDPMARALAARRSRNTGPVSGTRPPRTIGRASSLRRR